MNTERGKGLDWKEVRFTFPEFCNAEVVEFIPPQNYGSGGDMELRATIISHFSDEGVCSLEGGASGKRSLSKFESFLGNKGFLVGFSSVEKNGVRWSRFTVDRHGGPLLAIVCVKREEPAAGSEGVSELLAKRRQ